jgi:hypothetical protein
MVGEGGPSTERVRPSASGRVVHPLLGLLAAFIALVLSYVSWAAAGLHACSTAGPTYGLHHTLCSALDPGSGSQVRGKPAVSSLLLVAFPSIVVSVGMVLANWRSNRIWYLAAWLLALVAIILPSVVSFSLDLNRPRP